MSEKNTKIFSFKKYSNDIKNNPPTSSTTLTKILESKDGDSVYDKGFYCYFNGKNKHELCQKFPFPLATAWCIIPENEEIKRKWKEEEKHG